MKKCLLLFFSLLLVSCAEDDYDPFDEAGALERARESLVGQYYLSHSHPYNSPEEAEEYGFEGCESRFFELHEDGTFRYGNYIENCEKEYAQEGSGTDSWELLERLSFHSFIIELTTAGNTEEYSMEVVNGEYILTNTDHDEPQWGEGFTGFWTSMWLTPL